MTGKSFWAGAAIRAAVSAVVLSAAGQQTSGNPSVTSEQAGAGLLLFQTKCARGHCGDLSGGASAPPLACRAFGDVWSERFIRDSTLAAITSSNVNSLGGAWATQLPGGTNQTGLTMSKGLILVPTANCKVVALNAKTGEILWEFTLPERPARRGVAVGNDVGLVF